MKRLWFAVVLATTTVYAEPSRDFKARMKAGYELQTKQQWAEAVVEFEAAMADHHDARAYAELGWSAMQAGDLAKARRADVNAVNAATGDKLEATALFNLGTVQDRSGERLAARLSFEASLAREANPVVKAALDTLGTIGGGTIGGVMPNGCYDVAAQVLPAMRGAWIHDGAAVHALGKNLRYCDMPSRVVVAEITRERAIDARLTKLAGTLYAIARETGAVASGALAPASQCVDNCAPIGHAGCYETSGCTLQTSMPGARIFELSAGQRWIGDKDEATGAACGPEVRGGMMMCSTAHFLAIVDARACSGDQLGLQISVYDAAKDAADDVKPRIAADGDRDLAASVPTYRFGTVVLAITPGARPSAKLTVDKVTEDCIALAIR